MFSSSEQRQYINLQGKANSTWLFLGFRWLFWVSFFAVVLHLCHKPVCLASIPSLRVLANSRSGFSSPASPTTPSAAYQLSFANTYPVTATAAQGAGAARFISTPKIHDKWPDLQRKSKGWERKPKKKKRRNNCSPCEKHALNLSLFFGFF